MDASDKLYKQIIAEVELRGWEVTNGVAFAVATAMDQTAIAISDNVITPFQILDPNC